MTTQKPYRIFDAVLTGRRVLTPHLSRLTFGGEQVADMTTVAPDQRIKLFFPKADGSPSGIPHGPDWYDAYRSVPVAERAPMRTYTIRAIADGQLDVDFVLHGDNGPASRWALNAKVGDPIQISAPNARYEGTIGGYDWEPPAGVKQVLLIADETALPAIAGILEQMAAWPQKPRVQAFIEIPEEGDRLPLVAWDGLELEWLVRGSTPYGSEMVSAAERAAIPESVLGTDRAALADVDVDSEILWDRAEQAGNDFYAWVAGETAAVGRIRTLLIKEKQIDRRLLTLMGYWRFGKPHA